MEDIDFNRRFGGVERLYGKDAVTLLKTAHICVIGIGGVGSWAAEALARSAVGHLTLIDLDHIAESNINRQIHALSQTLGKSKVLAMKERILEINPMCQVDTVDDFITNENIEVLIKQHFNVVIDAIDQVTEQFQRLREHHAVLGLVHAQAVWRIVADDCLDVASQFHQLLDGLFLLGTELVDVGRFLHEALAGHYRPVEHGQVQLVLHDALRGQHAHVLVGHVLVEALVVATPPLERAAATDVVHPESDVDEVRCAQGLQQASVALGLGDLLWQVGHQWHQRAKPFGCSQFDLA